MSPSSPTISSDSFPSEQRIEMWNERVAHRLLRVQWDVAEGADLKAAMEPVICAGDVEIVNIASGPCAVTNTREHASQKDHRLSLYIVTSGHSVTTELAGGETVLRKTMGVLLDEGAYYRHRSMNEITRGFVLMLPKARLVEAAPSLGDLFAAPLDLSSGPFRVLQSYLGLFHAGIDLNDPALVRANADYVLDLIALAACGRGDALDLARARGLPKTRTAIILAEIERNLGDPKLSGAVVAARVGITERYLQQLMETHGETFSHHLLRLRLEKAAGMLVERPQMRISEIAYHCGFNDLSYFNRSFKKRFGESPRSYRR
jgi:AraC-like DNA-binding protein